MKRMFLILVFAMMAVAGFGQTKPDPVIDFYNKRFSFYKEYAVGYSLVITRSLYGKVRIIDKGRADLRVFFVRPGEAHRLNVKVVERAPDRFKGEWQFVTREGEEDFTIRITDWRDADVFVLVTEGYDPQAKKYIQKKK